MNKAKEKVLELERELSYYIKGLKSQYDMDSMHTGKLKNLILNFINKERVIAIQETKKEFIEDINKRGATAYLELKKQVEDSK